MFKKSTLIAFLIGWGFALILGPDKLVNWFRGRAT
jgi:hypothetical protein